MNRGVTWIDAGTVDSLLVFLIYFMLRKMQTYNFLS